MTRGRKRSVSSMRERVENMLGIDTNPYDLPPVWKDETKRFGIQDPDRIPVIGKYLKVEPKPKNTRWRQRSSSLPARYQACYALTPPEVEITMAHLVDYDRRDNLWYDYHPEWRPVYLEDWEEAHREWDTKCLIRHLQNHPPLGYMPDETKFKPEELVNPRCAPLPPGYVPPRPKSKALPPLPPQDERLTKDTTYLIRQFPSSPDGASSAKRVQQSKSKLIQRRRSSSESDVYRHSQYYREAKRREQRGEHPPKNDPNGDDDVGNVGRSGHLVRVEAPAPQDPNRSRDPLKATPLIIQAMPQFNPFHPPGGYDVETASIAALSRRDVAPVEKEVIKSLAHRAALKKLESNQVNSSAAQPQEAPHEPEPSQQNTTEPTRRNGARAKEGQERTANSDQKQGQRLGSESKVRQGPSSSSAGAQKSHRERPGNEEPRACKPSHVHVEQQAPKHKEEPRCQYKHRQEEERRPRQQTRTETQRQGGPESLSSDQPKVQTVAQEPHRHVERQPEGQRRARVQNVTEQETARQRVVRRSVSTSQLTEMSVRARVAHGPFTDAGPRGHVPAPIAPWTKLPNHPRPAHTTTSNHGPPSSSTTQPMPKAVRTRPSRVNLGPPPSLSAGFRKRAPSLPTSEAPAGAEDKTTTRVVETLKRKVSNSSFAVSTQSEDKSANVTHRVVETLKRKISIANIQEATPAPFIDKSTISAPVKYLNGGETGLQQLRHLRDLEVTEIELGYYVQYPPTPQSVLAKRAEKPAKAAAGAPPTALASSEAPSAVPAPLSQSTPSSPKAGQTVFIPGHIVNESVSSVSSYGSNASSSDHDGYSSSITSLNHPVVPQRTYEECISPSANKNGMPLTQTGPQTPPPTIDSLLAEIAADTRAARDVKTGKQKEKAPALPALPVDSVWEDEEVIKGYKPRRIVDVKRLIREHEERVQRECEDL